MSSHYIDVERDWRMTGEAVGTADCWDLTPTEIIYVTFLHLSTTEIGIQFCSMHCFCNQSHAIFSIDRPEQHIRLTVSLCTNHRKKKKTKLYTVSTKSKFAFLLTKSLKLLTVLLIFTCNFSVMSTCNTGHLSEQDYTCLGVLAVNHTFMFYCWF